MATTIKVWEIDGGLKPVASEDFSEVYKESDLESWIADNPELLGEKILVIGRQHEIAGVGRLDLLGIDQNGTLVIVELKRGQSSREAVAQALDYASWLNSQTSDDIDQLAQEYLEGHALQQVFSDTFGVDLPDVNCQDHRIILVAAKLDASSERIIEYLSERYSMDINAVFFSYSKLSNGKEILARTMLVADEARPRTHGSKTVSPSTAQLLAVSAEQGVQSIVEVCREARHFWTETRGNSYGGAFVYWAENMSGKSRSLFGFVPGGKNNPPHGELDVWVPTKNLAEVTGVELSDILKEFHATFSVLYEWKSGECWMRLKNPEQAKTLISEFTKWFTKAAPASGGAL